MRKHKDRKHDEWSASSTERNWLCPGNLAISKDLVKTPENKAAAWGTACHQVSEKLLTQNLIEIGEEITTERHVFYVDQEMVDCALVYTDYIGSRLVEGFDLYAVEKKFSLAKLGLPMEAGGSADAVLYHPVDHILEVVDLKTGKGKVVDAIGNPQERFYALGVLIELPPSMPVKTVMTTIVQPRLPHKDGIIRSESLHVGDLIDWIIDLDMHIRTTAEAIKTYETARNSPVQMDEWVDLYLDPGETQCTFCPAAGGCPALRKNALEIAGAWQDERGLIQFKSNLFAENSIEAVEADLDMLDHMESWIRERRALAHEMASQGYRFDHHVLVEKIGNRKFDGKNEDDIVAKIRDRIPISDEQLYDRKLKSPAGLERAIGKKAVETHLDGLIVRPITGTDLIRTSTQNRAPAQTVTDLLFPGVE